DRRGRVRRRGDLRGDRGAGRLCAGPPLVPGQARRDAALPAADHHPADHLWHPAGHGGVRQRSGRTVLAVILVNLVPSVPFVILTMTPFIEQINPSIESAAR